MPRQSIDVIGQLIIAGAQVAALDKRNRSPLLKACLSSPCAPLEVIRLLIPTRLSETDLAAFVNQQDTVTGETALIAFCKNGTRNKSFHDNAPIFDAGVCNEESYAILDLLLAAGADPIGIADKDLTEIGAAGRCARDYARPNILRHLDRAEKLGADEEAAQELAARTTAATVHHRRTTAGERSFVGNIVDALDNVVYAAARGVRSVLPL